MFDLFGSKRIAMLEQANFNLNRRLQQWEDGLGKDLSAIKGQVIAANRGMSRLIAKLDPNYGRDELDPVRKAESDQLSADIIKKLIAEHIESNRHNGTQT